MYSTCIHCHASLGRNDEIEHFPVGRRLAFDAARGRLWAVCERCGRWNLSPLEERWEAIEACERRFRATRLRVSTGNVGLARLREGLELVRIGEPLRPEFAAWRYGRQYQRRRWRHAAAWGAGAVAVGVAGTMVTAGLVLPTILAGAAVASLPAVAYRRHERSLVRLGRGFADNVEVRREDLAHSRLAAAARGEGWRLIVSHRFGATALEGAAARRALRLMLPVLNGRGASGQTVHEAVERVTHFDGEGALFGHAARLAERITQAWRTDVLAQVTHESTDGFGIAELMEASLPDNPGALGAMPAELRLALEMALHEESERRALDGELARLEAAWREAEEIAGIADQLLLPVGVNEWLRRSGGHPPAAPA
ncbi:MAG TPA: hypothetical protein VFS08_00895 [Gemmatimonadaceae bacterium]|nr:hypothetical protein [Gemmatimonadaceae bacterium]